MTTTPPTPPTPPTPANHVRPYPTPQEPTPSPAALAELVVRINTKRPGDGYDVYIGRANPRFHLEQSPWANPFRIGRDGDRADVLTKYRNYLMGAPHLLRRLGELRGKVLGCWCKPDPCHGDILAALANNPPAHVPDGPMDPPTQGCFGYYGYGTGWFHPEGQEAIRATRGASAAMRATINVRAFCDGCPVRSECWTEHQRRVGEAEPEDVRRYFDEVAEYAGTHNMDPQAFGKVAARRLANNDPDPWMRRSLLCMQWGMSDRETYAPPLAPGRKPS